MPSGGVPKTANECGRALWSVRQATSRRPAGTPFQTLCPVADAIACSGLHHAGGPSGLAGG